MFISLKIIRDLFPEFETAIYGEDSESCLCYYELFKPELFRDDIHILYVTDREEQLRQIQPPDGAHFLLFSTAPFCRPDNLSKANLLYVKTDDLCLVHDRLHDYFRFSTAYGLFSNTLLEHLFFESGIQSMIDKAYGVFRNPIFVFDAGFHLVAASWEAAEENSLYAPLLKNKIFSENEYKIINDLNHIHEKVKKSELPIQIRHPELDFDQLICQINTKKDVGHIVINASERPFIEQDHYMLLLLKEAIDQQLKKDEFIRNNRGFQYEYFIRDLLDEKIAIGKRNYDTLKYVEKEFQGNFFCIVVETAKSSSTVNPAHIRGEFESAFPKAKTLLYNGEIIILIPVAQGGTLHERDYEKADLICKKHHIFAGISNRFSSILEISPYYKQALRAIEMGMLHSQSPALHVYSRYYMEHLCQLFLQKESADTFCHPQLNALLLYDKKHHTDYARSLYTYLLHERNSVAAAKAMDIHPNTLKYRLKQINQLIDVNLENAKERQYLITSYEMYKNQ